MSGKNEFHYVGGELELFAEARNWKAYWRSQIEPLLCGDVLEVGAGLGANTQLLRSGRQANWLCLEPDRALLDHLRVCFETQPPAAACEIMHGTVADLDQGRQFDAILYIDVLEHIEDDRAELERAAGHLKPGGHLIVLSPAHQWLFSKFDEQIGHFRRYTRRSLLAIAPPGLRVRRAVYLDSCGLSLSLGNRLFLRQSLPHRRQIRFWDRVVVPVSRVLDPLLARSFGKTVLAVWVR